VGGQPAPWVVAVEGGGDRAEPPPPPRSSCRPGRPHTPGPSDDWDTGMALRLMATSTSKLCRRACSHPARAGGMGGVGLLCPPGEPPPPARHLPTTPHSTSPRRQAHALDCTQGSGEVMGGVRRPRAPPKKNLLPPPPLLRKHPRTEGHSPAAPASQPPPGLPSKSCLRWRPTQAAPHPWRRRRRRRPREYAYQVCLPQRPPPQPSPPQP
jgi:hypothetical protein